MAELETTRPTHGHAHHPNKLKVYLLFFFITPQASGLSCQPSLSDTEHTLYASRSSLAPTFLDFMNSIRQTYGRRSSYVTKLANIVIFLSWTILSLLSIAGLILLIGLCATGLWGTWYLRPFHDLFSSSTFLAYFFEMCFNIFFSSFLMYTLAMMTSLLVCVVTYNLPCAVKLVLLRLFRAVRSRIWAGRSLPVGCLYFAGEQFRPVFTHIILHLLGVTACVIFSGLSLGLASIMFTSSISSMETATEVELDLSMWIAKIFFGLMGIAGIGLVIPTFMIIRSMIRPFYSYRRPYPPEFYDSLFNLS